MQFTSGGTMLKTGGRDLGGLYDESIIRTIELNFSESNWWALLTQNYASKTDLIGTMTVGGQTFQKVGVRFKGQTSYNTGTSQKKSFNITLDAQVEDQNWLGYKTLNLNNAFDDHSFMREVLYLKQIRKHIPAAQANYVKLMINGVDWGIYANVQQLDKAFIREWFRNDNGTRWRADAPTTGTGGPGGPGGGGWGDGTAAINYLGTDTTAYQKYYTLKSTKRSKPWEDLVQAAATLNNTTLTDRTTQYPVSLDVDRILWHLASEDLFSDDDSYIYKGKMDYYLYWDKETGRLLTHEYDGNSVMKSNTSSWSPFYNETKVNYPLMNKVLAVPAYRQRYLAHLRTLMKDAFDPVSIGAQIDTYFNLIKEPINADPKKRMTYTAFTNEIQVLKNFVNNRRTALLANAEVSRTGITLDGVTLTSDLGAGKAPAPLKPARITVRATGNAKGINLYFGNGLEGTFTQVAMVDDGLHNDGAAGDQVYGAEIPGYGAGSCVRYYFEGIANDGFQTATYLPEGAEHELYVYQVPIQAISATTVVINELMAQNTKTVADEVGEYEDWIELYNTTNSNIDLSGYFLTDKEDNIGKWTLPNGTIIPANGYLIVWADENGSQGALHANFKLSASGEAVILSDPAKQIVDQVTFGVQEADKSYARNPNGIGNFVIQNPTFKNDNTGTTATQTEPIARFQLATYPNPVRDQLHVKVQSVSNKPVALKLYNILGQMVWQGEAQDQILVNLSGFPTGLYILRSPSHQQKVMVVR
ncbi:MAG: CotH kinase family protein [Bacteroidetes Order II. Incertae sedis bacterium]|nr:CotH kinase family protein [Bacteroidetes Order II. bacterium]